MAASARVETIDDRELEITRLFDAPRELVFRAWSDPALLLHWMGPRDYPAVQVESNFRVGGGWRIVLRDKDSDTELWQSGEYREITAPARIVLTFRWDKHLDGLPGPETLITLDFADEDGKTRMTFHQGMFNTASNRDGHRYGWNSAFDRLDDYFARR
jgi:uncharacterized protein YndB with AHSA1/START domain